MDYNFKSQSSLHISAYIGLGIGNVFRKQKKDVFLFVFGKPKTWQRVLSVFNFVVKDTRKTGQVHLYFLFLFC